MKLMDCWGVTGWSNSWTALGSDASDDDENAVSLNGYGVQRTVDPGVVYSSPAEIDGVPRWHLKPQSRGRIFEMVWPEEREPVTRSLIDIHSAITSRRAKLTADDPDLATLDTSIDLLLKKAALLHAADASIGFLQPNSCRVGESREGGVFVVLPDVGFVWDKKVGLMLPTWISEPALGLLFEHGAEQRNEEYLAEINRQNDDRDIRKRASEAAARELADVKILTRLVAATLVGVNELQRWCTDNKCLAKLPPKDMARITQAPIWDKVIAPALAGQFTTVKELRAGLATYKPSSHYLHEPPSVPWAGWAMLRRAGMMTAAAGVIGLLYVLSGPLIQWFQGIPAPFCRNVTEENPLYGKLFELEKSRESARGDIDLRPAFWVLLRECHSDHAALNTCGSDCLASLVDEWFRQAEEEAIAVRARLRDQPRPTQDELEDIETAILEVRQAGVAAKRSAGVVSTLERECKLRGGRKKSEAAAGPVQSKKE